MARPINETPILRGKDAIRFEERMKNVQKLDKEEMKRMKANYEKISKIANF